MSVVPETDTRGRKGTSLSGGTGREGTASVVRWWTRVECDRSKGGWARQVVVDGNMCELAIARQWIVVLEEAS